MFAEALHLCIANIENSLFHFIRIDKFLLGKKLKSPLINPLNFKETPVFQAVSRSFLKTLHDYIPLYVA